MVEMRWVWHDLKYGPPPSGAICVDNAGRLYQKLQYCRIVPYVDASGALCPSANWTE